MSPHDSSTFTEVDDWLDASLDQPPEERLAFLDRECPDPAVRARVRKLLERLEGTGPDPRLRSGGALDAALADGLAARLEGSDEDGDGDDDDIPIPERLGPFRIEEELGRGGMGVVYLARRQDVDYDQDVALKVVRGLVDGTVVRRRFAREQRILATLNHPHIARLLDGGVLDDGRPYLAMERVEGRPIDRFCNEEKLAPKERIRLFLAVARAVAHAHRRLIVHRDIKAANILVDGEGAPRLLDFGIASLVEAETGEGQAAQGGLTVTHHRPMTPAFASPEQLSGEPITTASDIYQLGLLLYGLLTGRWPYPRTVHESDPERAIREAEPVAASRALADSRATATARLPGIDFDPGLPAPRLRRWLRGDLDKILAQALRKEPERRYRSVEALVDDLEAFLDDRPVAARTDSTVYRAGKWLRRHRLGAAVAASLVLALSTAGVVHTVRLEKERDRAQREALRAQRTADFLADLFLAADPVSRSGEPPSVRELLDQGAQSLVHGLSEEPLTRARLMAQVADIYFSLGVYDRAEDLVQRAIDDFEQTLGEDHPETLGANHRLATILSQTGRVPQAELLLRRIVDRRRQVLGDEDPATLDSVVALAASLGASENGLADEAEELLREVLDRQRGQAAPERHTIDDWFRLAEVLMRLGDTRGCEIYADLVPAFEAKLGPEHPQTGRALYNLGVCRWHAAGDAASALAPLHQAVEVRRRALGPAHSRTLEAQRLVGWVLRDLERPKEAEAVLRDAVRVQREHGLEGRRWLRTETLWLGTLVDVGRLDEASRELDFLLDKHPFAPPIFGPPICRLATRLATTEKGAERARAWLEQLVAAIEASEGGWDHGVPRLACDPREELAKLGG